MLTNTIQVVTSRLTLRAWRDADRAPFAEMNADPEVMYYFAAPLSRQESDDALDRYNAQLERDGFTMFAAEETARGELIGILGMQVMRHAIPNHDAPVVEVGWRLKRSAWGKGFATDGARALLDLGFGQFKLPEIVAITAVQNAPSRHVMDKLGMQYDAASDFDHPMVPEGHRFRRHVIYTLLNPSNLEQRAETNAKNG